MLAAVGIEQSTISSNMPPSLGPLWEFFHCSSDKSNSSHNRAYCLGCIQKHRPEGVAIQLDENGKEVFNLSDAWFITALTQVKNVNGTKSTMMPHILKCENASKWAKKVAQQLKAGEKGGNNGTEADDESSDGEGTSSRPLKRQKLDKVKTYTQQTLKLPKGIDIPFTNEQKKAIKKQFGRATTSANLPFHWIHDPEVIALLLMFRSCALDVIPERRELAGRILNEAYEEVEEELAETLHKKNVTMTDGWKDISRNSIAGVNVSASFQPYLIELRKTNKDKKDAVSFCTAYEDMIDCAEIKYKCTVVAFTTDNDGGGGAGHQLLVKKRPWLLGTPCAAHQCQLVLGDYFKENKEAAGYSEEASELLGWILNHSKVRDIFDQTQLEKCPELSDPLAYITANLTRWTMHFGSFNRLGHLKDPLQHAAFLKRKEIIAAQVGAEKNNRKKLEMMDSANKQCDLIMNNAFWKGLKSVVEDIEPICYAVNICQSDKPTVRDGMKKRLEKRWKSYDQEFFVFALVLNPFEWLDRFGDAAKIGIWTLLEYFKKFYRRVNSRPSLSNLTGTQLAEFNSQKEQTENDAAKAFLQYMSWTGDFRDLKANEETVQKLFNNDPTQFWEHCLEMPAVSDLAEFAILILTVVVNSAADERLFSTLKITKTRLRNRLKLPRLQKMTKVQAKIRSQQMKGQVAAIRAKRKNHSNERVQTLLAVPRYRDLLENDDRDDSMGRKAGAIYTTSHAGWRHAFKKWTDDVDQEELEQLQRQDTEESGDDDMDIDESTPSSSAAQPVNRRWLPITLEKLFGGDPKRPLDDFIAPRTRRRAYDQEMLMMELLAAEYSDEPPDGGELEGSGDDYSA
ncbi:hypothetical protein D9758_013365 [Tetrapyrgos nigripes]|uniref:Uncharacterized protein n=1 Tax=Tetrapyrgos nigripes TaxID=182062 RepID=A0A8H5FNE4_9AGAR|nr:hypothetical protein D9758_013365 [Tetrapyrgos nigripes]